MEIKNSRFVTSAQDASGYPDDGLPPAGPEGAGPDGEVEGGRASGAWRAWSLPDSVQPAAAMVTATTQDPTSSFFIACSPRHPRTVTGPASLLLFLAAEHAAHPGGDVARARAFTTADERVDLTATGPPVPAP